MGNARVPFASHDDRPISIDEGSRSCRDRLRLSE
jgi:hypothetical protein